MLEAFEEWWKKALVEHGEKCVKNGWSDTPDYPIERMSHYVNQYRQGWQAALKWHLTWETDEETIEIIKKELGEQ